MTKKHPTHHETWYSLLYGMGGITFISAGIHNWDKPIIRETLIGTGLLSIGYASTPLWFNRVNQTNKRIMQNLQTFAPQTRIVKYKEQPTREFVFNADILYCPIPETMLMEFVDIGRKREMRARYGYQMGSEKRIKIHEAWSANYFTKTKRGKFIDEVYKSCIQILIVTGFFTIGRQGHPGRLIDPSIGTWQLVTEAKEWWEFLFQEKKKKNFLKLIRT